MVCKVGGGEPIREVDTSLIYVGFSEAVCWATLQNCSLTLCEKGGKQAVRAMLNKVHDSVENWQTP